jgi:hypothetical protein
MFVTCDTALVREDKTDRQLLCPRAPELRGFYDNACSMVTLECMEAAGVESRFWFWTLAKTGAVVVS